jgi:hypothetical protein
MKSMLNLDNRVVISVGVFGCLYAYYFYRYKKNIVILNHVSPTHQKIKYPVIQPTQYESENSYKSSKYTPIKLTYGNKVVNPQYDMRTDIQNITPTMESPIGVGFGFYPE